MKLTVIVQAIKKRRVPHCRMKPLRNCSKLNIKLAKRHIIIDLSKLANVWPDKKRNRSHGIKPKRNFISSLSSSISNLLKFLRYLYCSPYIEKTLQLYSQRALPRTTWLLTRKINKSSL
jgi:hypothetical protein